ncbi:MAG: hypothetical protein FD123_2504 [Bacteroidetes bacterium]|nr:MAG: hypothetical protein FD123_2504 [Bacteroidota bacterium]
MQEEITLAALFDYATEGMLVTNSKGIILRINPAAEKMFGYEKGELDKKPVEWLIPMGTRDRHTKHRDGFSKQPHPRSMGMGMDLFAMRKDGSEFPVEVSLSPFNVNDHQYIIAFIIDITIRKQQQDAIRAQKEKLENYSENLKASNEELQNFAYISSHDLQEPLRKIRAFGDRLKMMEYEKMGDQGKDYLDRMLNAAMRMQILISDLLAFSRLTTRARAFQPVNLDRVLSEVLIDMEVSIEKSGAIISRQPLPEIDAEPTQMRQLFQNLVSNAIKFRREGEAPKIDISWRKRVDEYGNELAEIRVADNGIGFEEKYNDRIFNIFQRLDGQKFEGSGIGLAICRKIAIRHGGNIYAESAIGKGSVFIITLKVKQPIPNSPEHTE